MRWGRVHVPLGDVPSRLSELPVDADLVVVCHLGGRSARATAWLLDAGLPRAATSTGGMVAYAAAGHCPWRARPEPRPPSTDPKSTSAP